MLLVDERKNYDNLMEHGEIVSRHACDTFVGYAKLKRFLVVSPRDIIFSIQFIKDF